MSGEEDGDRPETVPAGYAALELHQKNRHASYIQWNRSSYEALISADRELLKVTDTCRQ